MGRMFNVASAVVVCVCLLPKGPSLPPSVSHVEQDLSLVSGCECSSGGNIDIGRHGLMHRMTHAPPALPCG